MSAALPAGHQPGGPGAQLRDWTVTRQADCSILVTVREMADPAGLQRTLRAYGVPASVTFASQKNPACRSLPGAPYLAFAGGTRALPLERPLDSVLSPPLPPLLYPLRQSAAVIIHRWRLPSGDGVQI